MRSWAQLAWQSAFPEETQEKQGRGSSDNRVAHVELNKTLQRAGSTDRQALPLPVCLQGDCLTASMMPGFVIYNIKGFL